METNFTKGPLELDERINYTVIHSNEYSFAEVYYNSGAENEEVDYEKEYYANCKLIASATDLLHRLNSLVLSIKAHPDYVFGEEEDEWHDLISLAEQSIKKATE